MLMKKIIFLFLFILSTNLYPAVKISSYDITATYNETKNKISVTAKLEFQNTGVSDTLLLLFNSNCKINSIKYSHPESNVNYITGGKDTIFLMLNENVKSLPDFEITFNYDYPLEKDTVILVDRGYRWYPLIAENVESFEMTIEVPSNYIGLTAGDFIRVKQNPESRLYYFASKRNVFKIPLIIAPDNYYNVNEYDCNGVKTYFYSIAGNDKTPNDSINMDICSLIKYFNKMIGPYQFKRFSLVETNEFQGSNLGSSIITAGSNNIKYYSSGYKEWLDMDVASQWICAGVFPRLFCKGFWFMSISFPHYLRLMYIHDTYGEEAFEKAKDKLSKEYQKIAGSQNEVPILDVDYPNTKEKGLALYAKGVIVLDIIKNEMGNENWIKFLRYFYEKYSGKTVTLDTLTECINKIDPTEKCSNHLLKMLREKGMPE